MSFGQTSLEEDKTEGHFAILFVRFVVYVLKRSQPPETRSKL